MSISASVFEFTGTRHESPTREKEGKQFTHKKRNISGKKRNLIPIFKGGKNRVN